MKLSYNVSNQPYENHTKFIFYVWIKRYGMTKSILGKHENHRIKKYCKYSKNWNAKNIYGKSIVLKMEQSGFIMQKPIKRLMEWQTV